MATDVEEHHVPDTLRAWSPGTSSATQLPTATDPDDAGQHEADQREKLVNWEARGAAWWSATASGRRLSALERASATC
eukprot:COSAG01_NODE_3528_length_5967_cov_14.678255_11_plen_78_part_00